MATKRNEGSSWDTPTPAVEEAKPVETKPVEVKPISDLASRFEVVKLRAEKVKNDSAALRNELGVVTLQAKARALQTELQKSLEALETSVTELGSASV